MPLLDFAVSDEVQAGLAGLHGFEHRNAGVILVKMGRGENGISTNGTYSNL
jgi:hypothetical protein